MFEHKKLMDLETNGSNNCFTTSMLHKLVPYMDLKTDFCATSKQENWIYCCKQFLVKGSELLQKPMGRRQ